MSKITSIEQASLTDASAFLFRLYTLDAAWTEAVEQPEGVSPEDLPELRKLVSKMDSALVEIPSQAKVLDGVFASNAEKVEAACALTARRRSACKALDTRGASRIFGRVQRQLAADDQVELARLPCFSAQVDT